MINKMEVVIIALFVVGIVGLFAGCAQSGSDYQTSILSTASDTDMEADILASSTGRYDSNDAASLIKEHEGSNSFVILDVRTPEERGEGCIEDSITADFYSPTFKTELGKLDKAKTYLVYCRSGRRSADSLEMMQSMGFVNVYNLEGGINGWKDGGGKVVSSCVT